MLGPIIIIVIHKLACIINSHLCHGTISAAPRAHLRETYRPLFTASNHSLLNRQKFR